MPEHTRALRRAIDKALAGAEELHRLNDRPARVRIMTIYGDDRSGHTIHSNIAARSQAELHAQGLGTRCIPWDKLDARAGEIVDLVDEVVGDVTFRNIPSAPRPSRSESDLKSALFDNLIEDLGRTLTHSAMAVLEKRSAQNVSRQLGSEATMRAALKLAALAAFTANVGTQDAQDELRMAIGDVMGKMAASLDSMPRPALNS
ncbi:hypothetical protein ACWX0K_23880 (plasmid) [Nitrobacteraceae bacterium UC4446_H13]